MISHLATVCHHPRSVKKLRQQEGDPVPYKYFIYIITTLAILLSYLTLPGILDQVRNNPQIAYLTAHPDTAFTLFSQCQRKVTDVARCYNAYSAAVALAERHNCSDDGLKLRFRFKRLTEHAADDVIKAELKKDCPDRDRPDSRFPTR
ncbi:hypothetical protein WKH27_07675 [Pantoea agglomerans]|uniref:hypothetical protein n=1 Tax=Enterobacter agglomerans TaxID=549 RepID=UPI003C7C62D3